MPRIRSLKPEFWSSPGIETISPWARLLFQAMWNWADDAGRGTCNLRELQGFAFPNDTAEEVGTSDGFRRTMSEVRGQFGVIFYRVKGRPYYEIPSFHGHQRNERMAKGKHPSSTEGEPWDFMALSSDGAEDVGASDTTARNVSEAPTTSGTGCKEQGNRGTGESAPSGAGTSVPREINAGVVVGAWTDAYEATAGTKASGGMRGQVGREARQLLEDGADPALVLQAARDVAEKGRSTLEREYGPLAARARIRAVPDDEDYEAPQAPREVVFDPDPSRLIRWHEEQKAAWLAERGRA